MSMSYSEHLLPVSTVSDIENLLENWIGDTVKGCGQYELVKVDKILQDVSSFMTELKDCACDSLEHEKDPSFFHERRHDIFKMTNICGKIDVFLRSAFSIFDLTLYQEMTKKLQIATLALLDTLSKVTNLSKSAEKATNLIDLRELVLTQLGKKTAEWNIRFSELKKTPSPFDSKADLQIESLLKFLSSISLLSTQELFACNSPLCALTVSERLFCLKLESLECQISPMQVSIDMLTSKVADLNSSGGFFTAECENIRANACGISKNWSFSVSDFARLKNDTIGARLVSVYKYLNTQVLTMIAEIMEDLDTSDINREKIGPTFKKCSAVITLIRKISSSGMPGLQGCAYKFNLEIVPKWKHINNILEEEQKLALPFNHTFKPTLIQTPKSNHTSPRAMRKFRSHTPQAEVTREHDFASSSHRTVGLGINLHLGIKPSPSVPYSTSVDRIIDLDLGTSSLPSSSFQLALLQSANDDLSDTGCTTKEPTKHDERLSLPNTPDIFSLQSPAQFNHLVTTETTPYRDQIDDLSIKFTENSTQVLTIEEKKSLIQKLRVTSSTPSRIPTIVPNYTNLKLPMLKKKIGSQFGQSRLPTISPDNEVFCSPDRRRNLEASTASRKSREVADALFPSAEAPRTGGGLTMEPKFLFGKKKSVNQEDVIPETEYCEESNNVHYRSAHEPRLKAPARNVSLNGLETPDLAHSSDASAGVVSPVSWRSTSPLRPASSMGSRYDEQNLTPPLKYLRKRWK
ncbi:hypothetical protein METBIDRAFT_13718 [Metschnikowia bicuspidata var. bicuspidata NRRL YB-4993]|uniref:Karyogamy protein n=1 Tax=Metschnikowia bicuspidata var. bicuspidata NRRL YB-4993 TaxID=869754 RepID=A0A1A0H4F2_9ASCO|nr:hypothetical protein METBIDRAFT_13718 [Metschnikowia bicuspidata var. bicuspidata NRRL YB-4993]OBA18954.1 hypothetical protein METBIDRAFT_13718 [Metschnikowia bicuspidata var. bicuspidata NRRL YB-4993]